MNRYLVRANSQGVSSKIVLRVFAKVRAKNQSGALIAAMKEFTRRELYVNDLKVKRIAKGADVSPEMLRPKILLAPQHELH